MKKGGKAEEVRKLRVNKRGARAPVDQTSVEQTGATTARAEDVRVELAARVQQMRAPTQLLKRGAKGDAVRKVQLALLELGYDLPRWGADAELGTETFDAFTHFLHDHGKDADEDADAISDEELALLNKVLAATLNASLGPTLPNGRFHDVRAIAAQNNIGGRRSWKQITGITLHQTACVLGEKPKRWATVGAHLGVTRAGQVIWMHDFEKIVWHGNGFNGSTVGIEMDGTYAGVEGELSTFWRPKDEQDRQPQSPTKELVEAAKETVRWICAEVVRHGGRVQRLVAHRQSSRHRQSDPGSALWQLVAMPLHADKDLRLDDGGPGYKVGTGYAIPEKWDPSRKGIKY